MNIRGQDAAGCAVRWTGAFAALALCLQHSASSGQAMTDGAPETKLKEDGFDSAAESAFPMSPEMVRRYREIYEENERAMTDTPEPEAIIDMELVSLEPGGEVPVLNVAPGIATVVAFHDATGQPWPVRQHVIGSGEDYHVIQLGENSNSLAISSLVRVGWTNLVVALAEEPTAVVLRVNVDRKRTHFRSSILVMKPGPLSNPDSVRVGADLPKPGDAELLSVLTGAGPTANAERVSVEGIQASAWIVANDLYVRTKLSLLSPRWEASLSGPGGIRAYKLPASPVLLFSRNGKIVRAELELP